MTVKLHHGSLQATAHLEVWGWVFLAWFFSIALFPQLAGQPYHRLSGQAHWSERARLLFLSWITLALMVIWVPMGTVLALHDDRPMGKWASLGLGFTALLPGEELRMSSLSLPPAARTLRPGARIARVMILKPGVLGLLVMVHENSGRPWIGMACPQSLGQLL